MKNTTNASKMRLISIAAIAAVIVSSMIACDGKGGGGDSIPTKFKFNNAAPPSNLPALSAARAVMGGTTTDTDSYSELNTYYDTTLGGDSKIVEKVTPAAFRFYDDMFWVNVVGEGRWGLSTGTGTLIDFVSGSTLTVTNYIHEGYTVDQMYLLFNPSAGSPKSTFTVTTEVHADHDWRKNPDFYDVTFSDDYKTITIKTQNLMPKPEQTPLSYNIPGFLFGGTEYRFEKNWSSPFVVDIEGGSFSGGYVTPWNGTSTVGRSSITFNVNWDVTDLIEQRCTSYGGSGDHACADCVYVLKNKFWEGFSFTVD